MTPQFVKSLLAGMIVVLIMSVKGIAAAIPANVPPHGWSIRYSANSMHLTRPDLPDIEVLAVSDIRPDIPQDQKFEAAKTFFADRGKCPALASAQTQRSFAGYSAMDDERSPRCHLIAMGHWKKDGLQVALILKKASSTRPRKNSYIYQAIVQDVNAFFTLRYQAGNAGKALQPSAEEYAKLVPSDHKPVRMLRLKDGTDVYRALVGTLGNEPSPPKMKPVPAVLLFEKQDEPSYASRCLTWDPAMYAPDSVMPYHAENDCFGFVWRWKEDEEGKVIETRDVRSAKWDGENIVPGEPFLETDGLYQPFDKGIRLDLRLGRDREHVSKVANGTLPISELDPHDLILRPDGKFAAGRLYSATLEGGKTDHPVSGQYYFDGHVVTLRLDSGHVIHGFTGWLPHKVRRDIFPSTTEETISFQSAININGWLYFWSCPEDMTCQ